MNKQEPPNIWRKKKKTCTMNEKDQNKQKMTLGKTEAINQQVD